MPGISREDFRAVMGSFAAGVTIITTIDEAGVPQGLTATAFCSVSAEPPLCLVCIDRAARAYPALLAARRFAVNLLAAEQRELSGHFASKVLDKFEGRAWAPGPATGCPLLPEVVGHVECEVTAVHAEGDHDVFIGHVVGSGAGVGAPLVYFRGRYGEVVPR